MKHLFWTLCAAFIVTACSSGEQMLTPEHEVPPVPELPELPEQEALPAVDDVMSVIDDPYFARYCLVRFDQNGDGKLSMAEVERAERIVYAEDAPELQADYSRFISMKGIEYFKNLEVLEIGSSVLMELDLSYNSKLRELRFSLSQQECRLKKLNVSHTDLEELIIPTSELEELQVSASRLERLVIYSTDQRLKSLDVRYCEELVELRIYNSALTQLDLRYCPRLRTLSLSNATIQQIDLTQNSRLHTLDIEECGLSALNLNFNKDLESVNLHNNRLGGLDLSALKKLVDLNLSENPIAAIDLSHNEKLRTLVISSTQISLLNTDNNNELNSLICNNAKLSKLDLSTNGRLEELRCSGNQLTELDITPRVGENLKVLHCDNNRFVSLDLSTVQLQNWSKQLNLSTYENCFAPQPNLEVLTLSESIQKIDIEQFTGCPNLRKVILYAPQVPYLIFEGQITPSAATLYVPSEAIASYQTSIWGDAFAEIRSL